MEADVLTRAIATAMALTMSCSNAVAVDADQEIKDALAVWQDYVDQGEGETDAKLRHSLGIAALLLSAHGYCLVEVGSPPWRKGTPVRQGVSCEN
jgi:hypothetical protein